MIYKHFLGIYIDTSGVQCTGGYKMLPGLMPGRKFFREKTAVYESLKSMLEHSVLSRTTGLYITLPRKIFFTRQIIFPALPLDDVKDSVVNSLAFYCHLPVEDIYYDAVFTKMPDKSINALIYYAPRKKLDVYLNQLRESGHITALKSIAPFSYGAGPLYADPKAKKSGEKFGLMIHYPDGVEIAVYSGVSCVDSFLFDAADAKGEYRALVEDFLDHQEMSYDQIHHIHISDQFITDNTGAKKSGGCVSLAPVQRKVHQVRVDENPPRIKLFQPLRVLIPLFVFLAVTMAYLSMQIQKDILAKQTELVELNREITAVTGAIEPIVQARQALKKAAEYKEDVEIFVQTRPPLYTYINDLARVVPDDTWFAHMSYKPGIIDVQGEGSDVLTVVEALRTSGNYKEIKLQGAVSRTKEGKDKFRINLILDEPVDVIEGKKQ